ncbi:MAG: taurine ABC transporter substrate-binding protein [Acidobacteria bacterium]|nr:taurine ABC transporter substrate-binding protein [Acidobacteriota bacterium]
MGCCEVISQKSPGAVPEPEASVSNKAQDRHRSSTGATWNRRTALKSLLGSAGVVAAGSCGESHQNGAIRVRLAFCGQLLCVVPYEVARVGGHFASQGLDVELVYTRGGSAAMQALIGGAVDYAGTSLDVALQAAANGASIRRIASTGRLPLFALAVAPTQTSNILGVKDLEARTVGISGLGNADHALLLFLLDQAGADADRVDFATIGTNLFDALRIGQVDAGMLQEPALSLITEAGGRELVNFMELRQAHNHLGGTYEFMGVSVRNAERNRRLNEIQRLAAGLEGGLADTRRLPPSDIVAALPEALVAGSNLGQLERILDRYRLSLYPESVGIDIGAAERVVRAQEIAGLLSPEEINLESLLDTKAVAG